MQTSLDDLSTKLLINRDPASLDNFQPIQIISYHASTLENYPEYTMQSPDVCTVINIVLKNDKTQEWTALSLVTNTKFLFPDEIFIELNERGEDITEEQMIAKDPLADSTFLNYWIPMVIIHGNCISVNAARKMFSDPHSIEKYIKV